MLRREPAAIIGSVMDSNAPISPDRLSANLRAVVEALPDNASGTPNGRQWTHVVDDSLRRTNTAVLLAGLAVVMLASRLPFISQTLYYWDSVHFALALENFDIARHQPHPPGYILFVALGYVANRLFADVNHAYIAIGIGAAMLGAVAMYRLGVEAFDRETGLAAALLLGFSPMLWFYSEIGALYGVEPALVIVVLLLCLRARKGQVSAVYAGALALGLVGGIRQTTLVFLFPLWLYAVWPRRVGAGLSPSLSPTWGGETEPSLNASLTRGRGQWSVARIAIPLSRLGKGGRGARHFRHLFLSLMLLGFTVLAWLIPLLVLAGGPEIYFRELAALNRLDAMQTSIVYCGIGVLPKNILYVVAGLLNGLQAGAILYVLWLLRLFPYRSSVASDSPAEPSLPGGSSAVGGSTQTRQHQGLGGWFVALSLLPATCFFVFDHLGQLGYTAILLPVLILYLPPLARSFVADLAGRVARQKPFGLDRLDVRRGTTVVIGLVLALYVVGFLAAHFPISRWGIEEKNERWAEVDRVVQSMQPEDTVLLTDLEDLDSFRHLFYYCPDYHIYVVDAGTGRAVGWRFEGYHRVSNYGFSDIPKPRQRIELEAAIANVLVFDEDLAQLAAGWREVKRWDLPEQRTIYQLAPPEGVDRVVAIGFDRGLMEPVLED